MAGTEPPSSRASALAATAPQTQGKVEVVYAVPERQRVVVLDLPEAGLTALEAVERSGLLQEFPELVARPLAIGIYGTVCEGTRPLRNGDRVELYRPLRHDPRDLRRERAAAAAPRLRRRG
jgi:uncharacterized protein